MKRMMHDILELPQRSEKPRKKGLTMVLDRAWVGAGSSIVAAYKDYIDLVKSTAQCLWVDEKIIQKNMKAYRRLGIDVQIGGIPYEIAVLEGKQKEYMKRAKMLGSNVVEVESHAAGLTLEQMKTEVKRLKKDGFKVVGEVGAKWADHDETRPSRDAIYVDKVVAKMSELLEVGADHVYWEGMVVRALLGNRLENQAGQEQFLKVAKAVGQERIIFEMWSARGNPNTPLWAWLVKHLGPDVNLANINLQDVSQLESIRRGCSFDPGHPYVRWLSHSRPTPNWWEMESPDYKVDLPG
ncbi:MAG: phosphosulfolactate synthase [Deltaproteobacteria bacterium]|nr:phosphosulfolactate synthase [Deltaproteobacteria bacterium]